jgi:hypothetical protein
VNNDTSNFFEKIGLNFLITPSKEHAQRERRPDRDCGPSLLFQDPEPNSIGNILQNDLSTICVDRAPKFRQARSVLSSTPRDLHTFSGDATPRSSQWASPQTPRAAHNPTMVYEPKERYSVLRPQGGIYEQSHYRLPSDIPSHSASAAPPNPATPRPGMVMPQSADATHHMPAGFASRGVATTHPAAPLPPPRGAPPPPSPRYAPPLPPPHTPDARRSYADPPSRPEALTPPAATSAAGRYWDFDPAPPIAASVSLERHNRSRPAWDQIIMFGGEDARPPPPPGAAAAGDGEV